MAGAPEACEGGWWNPAVDQFTLPPLPTNVIIISLKCLVWLSAMLCMPTFTSPDECAMCVVAFLFCAASRNQFYFLLIHTPSFTQ